MNTNGWDIVSACRQDDLNKLLATRMKKTPPTLKYSDGSGIAIDATFGPWEISSFGNATKLTIVLPFKSGTLKNASKFATKPTVDLAGVQMEISLDIDFVEDAKGATSNLQFQFKTAGKSAGDKTKGAVFVINADLNGALKKEDPSGNSATDLKKHIPQVLIANADKLNYALTSLNMSPSGDQAWLKPVAKHFMFAQGKKDANGKQGPGHLVVCTMVTDRTVGSKTDTIDEALTDNDNPINMAFDGPIFMRHFLMPHLADSFENPSMLEFRMTGDSVSLWLGVDKTGWKVPAECAPVDHWGTDYTPYLYPLNITLDDDELKLSANGWFDITGLADSSVTFWIKQSLTAHFDASKQSMSFKPYGETKSDYTKHIPAWIYFITVGAAALVAGIVLLVVTAVVDVVIAAVTTAVAKKVTAAGGGQAKMGNLASASISWPGSDGIEATDASLASALVISGKLK